MVTYVNSVLISNLSSGALVSTESAANNVENAGKWVVITTDPKPFGSSDSSYPYITTSNAANYDNIKVGLITNKTMVQHKPDGTTANIAVIKWSNVINKNDIKSYTFSPYAADTQDTVYIDFSQLDAAVLGLLNDGGKRLITRLTFKDLPTRYRKWTESYEYVTSPDDTKATIAANIAEMINKEWKRARVTAVVGNLLDTEDVSYEAATGDIAVKGTIVFRAAINGTTVQLVAMQYDDDNAVDTLNYANTVRFNVNIYYTDPAAEGWASKNKFFPTGVTIDKVPGKISTNSSKLVRDTEAQAMGYLGILNRGEGTWPIIKPEMQTVLTNSYDSATLEFETSYHAADDIVRKTKQTLQMYGLTGASNTRANSKLDPILDVIEAFIA